ncbi:efflux RND transporter permease subunit, partial [Enterobacter hormaechei]|nr:efflux RND transporter permease subunit [Enterobacter hormaechei]
MQYSVPYDTSRFVDVAIEKVIHTLIEAMVLVFLVMFLFLQNVRYTLIPSIVVPVCLLGTLMVMHRLGFSINMMTMYGMVLAIGILVDDAIVVVENVHSHIEEGKSPVAAALIGAREVAGPVIAMT